jgi:hypothetical protein
MMVPSQMAEWGSSVAAAYLSAALVTYWLAWSAYSRTFHPLAKVPGPVWASLSRTWLMYRMYHGDYQLSKMALHEK